MIRIEPGRPEDGAAVSRMAAEVFADYGDYGRILPRFYSTQGVHSFIAWQADEPVGFLLMGFLPWTGGDQEREWWLVDLLAVAVAQEQRRRGVGRALLERALGLVDEMTGWRDVREIQLTCAADNQAGLAFFRAFGFEVVDEHHGAYSGGQPAWRLARPVALTPP